MLLLGIGRHHGRDEAMIQFTKSLSGLAVEEVDLFLLHYPACWPGLCGEGFTTKGTWHDSWRALEDLVDKKLVRAIGSWPLWDSICASHLHPWVKGWYLIGVRACRSLQELVRRLQLACAMHEPPSLGLHADECLSK